MEIVLAVALVVLLLGMFVGTFSTWYDSERMPEGARRLESILRLARAEACASGRRIRLTFDDETLDAAIVWEPKPLEEPGTFVPHSAAN